VPAVAVSGLTGKGLDDLMETVSTLAEVAELRAEAEGRSEGVVLESQVLQGRGCVQTILSASTRARKADFEPYIRNVATVLVTRGELSVGSIIVAGQTWAKVRTLTNDKGANIKKCGPGTPVAVTGWKELPSAGEEVLETKDGEASATKAVANRVREAQIRKDVAALDVVNEARRVASAEHAAAIQKKKSIQAARSAAWAAGERMPAPEWVVARNDLDRAANDGGNVKELLLVVKGDVSGTVEAVVSTLETIGNSEVKARIIRSGVGDVQPSDVEFAAAAGGQF
jgi:translation initiation factor IF-2